MPKKADPGLYTRAGGIDLRAVEGEGNENRFELSFSSEDPYDRGWGAPEILSHDKSAIDLRRLKTAGALLFDHGHSSLGRMPVGRVEKVSLDEAAHKCRAVISFDDEDEDAVKICRKVKKKMIGGVSVGYRVAEYTHLREGEKTADGRFKGPVYLATKWEPYEISLTAIPADYTVGVGRNMTDQPKTNEEVNTMPEMTVTTGTGEKAAATATPAAAPAAATPPAPEAGAKSIPAPDAAAQAVEAERKRTAAIMARCQKFGIGAGDMISRGITVEEANAEILTQMEKRSAPVSGGVHVTKDEADKFRAAATDSILMRGMMPVEKPADGAPALRSMSLRDMARECLTHSGKAATRWMSDEELMRSVLTPDSEFLSIINDSVNKSMASAYAVADVTYPLWTSKGTHSDFKPKHIYQISEAGELDEVQQNGEIKMDHPSDSEVTSCLATFGKKFGFDRRALINDDIDVLTKIPAAYVRSAKRGVNKAVYKILQLNPTMADGNALFSSAHKNLGTAAAPSVASYQEAFGLMMHQTGLRGMEALNIRPKFVICDPYAYAEHASIINSTADPSKSNAAAVNPFGPNMMPLTLIMDADLLASASATGANPYFFVADPMSCGAIEVGFLNGQEEPILESRVGFDFLGIEYRIIHDRSVTLIDHRGLVKNADA